MIALNFKLMSVKTIHDIFHKIILFSYLVGPLSLFVPSLRFDQRRQLF